MPLHRQYKSSVNSTTASMFVTAVSPAVHTACSCSYSKQCNGSWLVRSGGGCRFAGSTKAVYTAPQSTCLSRQCRQQYIQQAAVATAVQRRLAGAVRQWMPLHRQYKSSTHSTTVSMFATTGPPTVHTAGSRSYSKQCNGCCSTHEQRSVRRTVQRASHEHYPFSIQAEKCILHSSCVTAEQILSQIGAQALTGMKQTWYLASFSST
jgi:hypothetical protein